MDISMYENQALTNTDDSIGINNMDEVKNEDSSTFEETLQDESQQSLLIGKTSDEEHFQMSSINETNNNLSIEEQMNLNDKLLEMSQNTINFEESHHAVNSSRCHSGASLEDIEPLESTQSTRIASNTEEIDSTFKTLQNEQEQQQLEEEEQTEEQAEEQEEEQQEEEQQQKEQQEEEQQEEKQQEEEQEEEQQEEEQKPQHLITDEIQPIFFSESTDGLEMSQMEETKTHFVNANMEMQSIANISEKDDRAKRMIQLEKQKKLRSSGDTISKDKKQIVPCKEELQRNKTEKWKASTEKNKNNRAGKKPTSVPVNKKQLERNQVHPMKEKQKNVIVAIKNSSEDSETKPITNKHISNPLLIMDPCKIEKQPRKSTKLNNLSKSNYPIKSNNPTKSSNNSTNIKTDMLFGAMEIDERENLKENKDGLRRQVVSDQGLVVDKDENTLDLQKKDVFIQAAQVDGREDSTSNSINTMTSQSLSINQNVSTTYNKSWYISLKKKTLISQVGQGELLSEDLGFQDPMIILPECGTFLNPIDLDIGGKIFRCLPSLLAQWPLKPLAKMIHNNPDSTAFFIDRNPLYFEPILQWYRTGKVFIPTGLNIKAVQEEASFFDVREEMFHSQMFENTTEKMMNQDISKEFDNKFIPLKKHGDEVKFQFYKSIVQTLHFGSDPVVFRLRKHEQLVVESAVGQGKLCVGVSDEDSVVHIPKLVVYENNSFLLLKKGNTTLQNALLPGNHSYTFWFENVGVGKPTYMEVKFKIIYEFLQFEEMNEKQNVLSLADMKTALLNQSVDHQDFNQVLYNNGFSYARHAHLQPIHKKTLPSQFQSQSVKPFQQPLHHSHAFHSFLQQHQMMQNDQPPLDLSYGVQDSSIYFQERYSKPHYSSSPALIHQESPKTTKTKMPITSDKKIAPMLNGFYLHNNLKGKFTDAHASNIVQPIDPTYTLHHARLGLNPLDQVSAISERHVEDILLWQQSQNYDGRKRNHLQEQEKLIRERENMLWIQQLERDSQQRQRREMQKASNLSEPTNTYLYLHHKTNTSVQKKGNTKKNK